MKGSDHTMIVVLLALLVFLPSINVPAQEIIVDGMQYVIFRDYAVLTKCMKEDVGDLVIPESVTINETVYPVTAIGGQIVDDGPYHNNLNDPHPFRECSTITSIKLPKTIELVGIYAFQGCKNLKRVELTENVKLEPHAFSYCTSLRKVLSPKGCRMGESAFGYCNLDTLEYEVGSSITDNWNFCGSTIESIFIPQTMERLPGDWLYATEKVGKIYLFKQTPPIHDIHNYSSSEYMKNALKAELYVPYGSTETYRKHADWGLFEKIRELPDTIHFDDHDTVPNADSTRIIVEGMQYVVFRDHAVLAKCMKENVGDLVIPESVTIGSRIYPVTSVGGQVEYDSLYTEFDGHNVANDPCPFAWCKTITSVQIPKSVNSIGHRAFIGCDNLTTVTLPEAVELGQNCFAYCSNLKQIIIPTGVIKSTDHIRNDGPFSGCNFDTVEYETGRESINGDVWFNSSSIETLIVPSTVKSIDNGWLRNINKLRILIIYAETPPLYPISAYYEKKNDETQKWQWESLESGAMNAILIVPDGAIEAYRNHKDWGLYKRIYTLSEMATSSSEKLIDNPSNRPHPQRMYNLQGQQISVPQKGLNIVDGKKVWVK